MLHTHTMRGNDLPLEGSDIRQLETADQVAAFFQHLKYDITDRTNIPDYTALGMGGEELRQLIKRIEVIGKDPTDGEIVIYLFEVRSVTAKLRNDIARRFRERPENALLVLTKDYQKLEFVLLDRLVSTSQSRRIALKQAIRPIPLTVDRLHPDPIALRVLKRFTFTEDDADYQWEKLRSAYVLAAWTEQYFNNRALFSDYYLNHRLTDNDITPAWQEDVRPIGQAVFNHLATAPKQYTRQHKAVIQRGLYEPLFDKLGFAAVPPPSSATTTGKKAPDYLLYSPADTSKPIAAALTYVWNRNLDDEDEIRELPEADGGTPKESPGALVVSLLEEHIAPWVIVTNGKLWRLYSATASNKATNYYEVDLEEALAANEQLTALKYWWLMFRREAFTGFLDSLLKESADYARELGERLKDRVFVDIFPQFAKGFIANMRAQGNTTPDLDAVFSGTMTFLYRLMFTLYAESLDLLPVNEAHGYREQSLYSLKQEIAQVAGTVQDQSPDKLNAKYKATSTTFYERLGTLFTAINEGSADLNLPTYNGGLFSSATPSGAFLARYAIPDSYLALGLDRLTRDVEKKTQALAFIDFKSLGVRQLGSIYEGLLEFRLRTASTALAVTKVKGKEIYQPAAKVKNPLETLAKGAVYLENDKQERKATGSYYTPDYIVKYIVRHTVGPVLDRQFAACAPRLHAAQKGYREFARLQEARRKSGTDQPVAAYWNSDAMQQLVDDCLNVRVLDPAMGSGHFLVEVVDYISNRLLDFLNGWTENPVWAFIDRTRQDIIEEMEHQSVSIDPERLTRVALLKRAVLKRCVYGVDLNLMAVELAKVSLWLDAFTLGAPLSFLDHHLKHGNSLIGARLADVQAYLKGGTSTTVDMFSGSKFVGVMLATDLMRQVSYLSDNTIDQTRRSAQAYRDASDHLAPYKRVLDVYTSRWFGNAPPKKGLTDTVRLFLQDHKTEAWFSDPTAPLDNSLFAADTIAATALQAAEEKRFFHWELEFPEVFFAPSTPGGQDVQLREDGGFDAVVGNPPYVGSREMSKVGLDVEKIFWSQTLEWVHGIFDIYVAFAYQAEKILTVSGMWSFIIPNKWLAVDYGAKMREALLDNQHLKLIANVSRMRVFDDASVYPVIVLGTLDKNDDVSVIVPQSAKDMYTPNFVAMSHDRVIAALTGRVSSNIENISVALSELGDIHSGIAGFQAEEFTSIILEYDQISQNQPAVPFIVTGNVDRYEISPGNVQYMKTTYKNPQILLDASVVSDDKISMYQSKKIIIAGMVKRIETHIDDIGYGMGVGLYAITNCQVNNYYLIALLNSWFLTHIYREKFDTKHLSGGYLAINKAQLEQLPIRRISFTTPAEERERLAREAIGAYDLGDTAGVLRRVQATLAAGQTDVVHDVLAHLAQTMIDLNKQKQAEVRRFLGWLEERLRGGGKRDAGQYGALLDSFTGKTIIQGYLGDYQKGERELPWEEFRYRLWQNRTRYAAALTEIEGELQREYEASLATLIPIKRNLARTDALIDKIVYRLYGLTDAEIELIERPGYEQALAEAKKRAIADEKIDDEAKLEKIAEGVLSASTRFFERVATPTDEEILDRDLPTWRRLPPEAPQFLLTGDYVLRTFPEHMDFSSSVIPYTKAVEVMLDRLVFQPFRAAHTDADVTNDMFKEFMTGKRKYLTLGNYNWIVPSSKETPLRSFMQRVFTDTEVIVQAFKDNTLTQLRNKAAHDEVMTRDEARQVRAWALTVLGMVDV